MAKQTPGPKRGRPTAVPSTTPTRRPVADRTKAAASEPPATRLLRVFAFDPSLSTEMANYEVSEVVTRIPWERDRVWEDQSGALVSEPGLSPGPTGDYLEVIDVDPASGCAYEPVDLNDPHLLATNGLPPSEGNPKFHQQMVYAVAMTTIQHFERALGRQVFWSDGCLWGEGKDGVPMRACSVKTKRLSRLRSYDRGPGPGGRPCSVP